MSDLETIGVTEDGDIKYIDVHALVFDAAGGIIGDATFRAYYRGKVMTRFSVFDDNLTPYQRKKHIPLLSDEARETSNMWFKKLNKNVPEQIKISRYAVNIDVLQPEKSRKIKTIQGNSRGRNRRK
jgi:hypothetical protein